MRKLNCGIPHLSAREEVGNLRLLPPINLFALAMKSGTTASNLRETIFAYPTLASDVQYMI
jgi:hypothetical protein